MEFSEVSAEVEEGKLEEARRIVKAEKEDYKKRYGREGLKHYFNNFHVRLPDYIEPNRMYYRNRIKEAGDWNKKRRETIGEDRIARHPDWYSERGLNQTWEEYFKTIDKAIEAEGFSLDEISIVVNKVHHALYSREYEEFFELVEPIWIRLYAMGYTEVELSS